MASSSRIFIGNIPYNATEDEVRSLCEEVGPVVSFRIVNDKDTGKPKGFGFCEYRDEATAFSALRNLQEIDLHGRRLKVNFAANDKSNHQPIGLPAALDAARMMGLNGGDAMTAYLSKMSRNQLAQMVSEMKGVAVADKEMAREILVARPQLSRALLQAQILLGLVTPQMLLDNNGVKETSQVAQKVAAPMMQVFQRPQMTTAPAVGVVVDEAAMLQQVASLSSEAVAALAPELRQQVMQIQQMFRQQGHKIVCKLDRDLLECRWVKLESYVM